MRPEVREALELLEQDGRLSADGVVEAATPAGSVLHPYIFSKSDAQAAAEYRFGLAEQLIRRYKVEITVTRASGNTKVMLQRGYQSERRMGISEVPRGSYKRTDSLSPVEQNLILQRMRRELGSLRQRYGHLQEFWSALAEMSETQPFGQSGETAAASG